MRLCHFEDRAALEFEPVTLTRPVHDLVCGATTLAVKQRRCFGAANVGALVRPSLADLCRSESPGVAVNDETWLRAAPTVLVNGRWLPPRGATFDLGSPHVGVVDDEVAYAVVNAAQLTYCSNKTLEDCLRVWKSTLPRRVVGGRLVRRLWELVAANGEQIEADYEAGLGVNPRSDTAGVAIVGPADRLLIDGTSRVDPFVVADTRGGPVVVAAEAVVGAFTRLEGPCYIGTGTHLNRANIRGGTTLGPHCRVGGEVECAIIQGYANKAHEGFLGHSYVGSWVNLGAGTQCSDLRNDYGEVRVSVGGALVATGQTKVGCFIGDHAKVAIGTLLNTGSNVGAFCNLLPGGLLPRYVPSFTTCDEGRLGENGDWQRLMTTAATVMGRRGRTFTEAHEALARAVYEQTAGERRRLIGEDDGRRLRLSA